MDVYTLSRTWGVGAAPRHSQILWQRGCGHMASPFGMAMDSTRQTGQFPFHSINNRHRRKPLCSIGYLIQNDYHPRTCVCSYLSCPGGDTIPVKIIPQRSGALTPSPNNINDFPFPGLPGACNPPMDANTLPCHLSLYVHFLPQYPGNSCELLWVFYIVITFCGLPVPVVENDPL